MALEDNFFGLDLGLFDDDFFGLPAIDPLSDFSIDCEGTDIDTLIRTLEETEKLTVESGSGLFNQMNTSNVDLLNAKCKTKTKLKALGDDKVVFRRSKKKKGISLLAKPSNFREKKTKGKSISPTRFATYFYEDHNYCPLNNTANSNSNTRFSINETMVTENKSLHNFNTFEYLNDFENFSLEIESEVIMNFEVENAIDDCCESVISNDDLNKESVYSSNSESESARASSVNEISLETLDDTDKEAESSLQVNCDVRSNGKASKVFRVRRLSTRSSLCSSRSSSVSSSYSSCSSCCGRSASRCRSRTPSHGRVRSRSRSVSSHDSRRNKFRRKRSWRKESDYKQNAYTTSEACSEDRKNWFFDRRKERLKDVEERRIVYVGNIPEGTTKTDLRYWFAKFGPISQVSLHFRDYGNNYAFVTFQRRADAYEAVQRGNEDSRHPVFDLSFGGRRNFCKNRYEDLDRMEKDKEVNPRNMDFDSLLRSTKTRYRQ